jgi:hypothetical protein
MGAGKRAAADIDAFLKNPDQPWWVEPQPKEEHA